MKTLRSLKRSKRIAATQKLNRVLDNITTFNSTNEIPFPTLYKRYSYETEF